MSVVAFNWQKRTHHYGRSWMGRTLHGFGPYCKCGYGGHHDHWKYGFDFGWLKLVRCRWWNGKKWEGHISISFYWDLEGQHKDDGEDSYW